MQNVPLERVPLAPQYPFERAAAGVLQVPERQKKVRQFGGFAYPKTPPHSPLVLAEALPDRQSREGILKP